MASRTVSLWAATAIALAGFICTSAGADTIDWKTVGAGISRFTPDRSAVRPLQSSKTTRRFSSGLTIPTAN